MYLASEVTLTTRHKIADEMTTPVLVGVFPAIGLSALLELLVAIPLPRWLYLGAVLFFLSCGLLGIALDPSRRRTIRTTAGLLLVVATLAVLHLVPWSSRKPFLNCLNRIQVGMTQAEVERIMADYMRGTGWPANRLADANAVGEFAIANSIVFRHSNDGDFDSDWGVVSFRDGKVVSVEFMPD